MDCSTKLNIAVLIVNSIAALFAVIAAALAVHGNRQAREASKASEEQFEKNMHELNRSINVSLFDMRSEMLIEVKYGSFIFDRTRAKMLFSDEIDELIEKYDKESAEATRNKHLRQEYVDVVRQRLSDDTYDETADFLRQIQDYEVMNPEEVSAEAYEQMRESIRSRRLYGKWHHGASPLEYEYADYISADDEYNRHFTEADSIRQQLQEKMEQFIETSIQ